MAEVTREQVLESLRAVMDPDLHRDIVTLGFVKLDDVQIRDGEVKVRVVLTTPACPVKEKLREQCKSRIEAVPGVRHADVHMDAVTTSTRGAATTDRLPQVRNIIAVGSGKGGVGKSTVAVNLALALARTGAKVGLLDADIYGPSIPIMLGLKNRPPAMTHDQKIEPIERYGIATISMGFLLKDTDAVVWRGPMLGKALQQFIEDVAWGELDYLVMDLPPGTGDVQLSLAQLVPVDGAVVVTTPQDVAFADVRRAIKMFEMTKVPVLGLVENMAHFVCPDNGKTYHIFGQGRTAANAGETGLSVLASLPLDLAVAPASDRCEPIVVAQPDGEQARLYATLAGLVAAELSKRHAAKQQKASFKEFFKVQAS